MKTSGLSSATTLPTSMGMLAPVLAMEREPDCTFAVTSQPVREQARPRSGARVAAVRFCLRQSRVRAAGRTAEEIITPIIR